MSGSSAQQLVSAYLASKGLPMTGENIRRALEMNAANPGVIKGLVNQEPPPPDAQGGAGPTSNARGSAAGGLAQRMHQTQPQQQQQQLPQAQSDASQPMPQTTPDSGNGMLGSLAALILGGGGMAGLAHMFGRSGANDGAGMPSPTPLDGVKPFTGVASPMPPAPSSPAITGVNPIGPSQPGRIEPGPSSPVISGVDPIGPAQPGRLDVGPSSAVPGVAEMSNAAVHNPGSMDWEKILGEISHMVRR